MNKDSLQGSSKPTKPWRRWSIIVAVWIIVPILILGGIEVGLRLAGYGVSVAPFRAVETDRGRIHICNFEYLYWIFNTPPNTSSNYVEFVIPEKKEANTYRIFVFGSSAAFGWTHNSSFAQMLQIMLMQRFPGVRFEVFNLANGGLNSSIMRPLARACAKMQPDAFLIYMGNNEVHGPYGLITEFNVRQGHVPTATEIWLHQSLRHLRLGQLLDQIARNRNRPDGAKGEPPELQPDDPRLAQVWRNYEYNLSDMFKSAASAGANVFVSTLGANLRHWPPQPNLVWNEMSQENQSEFDRLINKGKAFEESGHWAQAQSAYAHAESINDTSPYLFFRQANCLWALGEYEQAKKRYEMALEQDSFVWVRAKEAFNDTIRRAVNGYAGDNVVLVEGRSALEDAAPHAIPGNESFADGCHFRPEGNYVLAKAFFEQMIPRLPAWVKEHEDRDATLPDLADIFEVLGFSTQLREEILEQLVKKSLEHGMDSAGALQAELDQIRQHPIEVDYSRQFGRLRKIIESGTEDIQLAYKFIGCLGRLPGFADQDILHLLERLSERYAFDRFFQHEYALLLDFYDRDEAREQVYKRLLCIYPGDETSYLNLAPILVTRGACKEMEDLLEQATRNEMHEHVYPCLRGELLRCQNNPEAITAYMKALEEESVAYKFALDGLHKSVILFPEASSTQAPAIRALVETHYQRNKDWKLTEILRELNFSVDAAKQYFEILSESPDAQLNLNMLEVLFNKWVEQNRDIEFWKAAVKAHPEDFVSWFFLGMAYERENNLDLAYGAYEKSITINAGSTVALYKLGMFKVANNAVDEGLAYLMKVVQANPQGSSHIAVKCKETGDKYKEKSDDVNALKLYLKAYEILPGDPFSQVRIGECFEALGDREAAREEYKRILMKAPESPFIASLLDNLCAASTLSVPQENQMACDPLSASETEISVECLNFWHVLTETQPNAVTPHFYHGVSLDRLGKIVEARQAYLTVLERQPDHALAHLHYGNLELQEESLEAGLEHLTTAVSQDKTLSGQAAAYCAEAAACLAASHKPEAAIGLLTRAIQFAPDDLWHRVHLGELHESIGDLEAAKNEYKTVLMKAPESPVTARKMQELMEKLQESYGAIIAEWKAITDSHPQAAVPLFYLGLALEKAGKIEEAKEAFNRSREINPNIEALIETNGK